MKKKFSAMITCFTEVEITVIAESANEALSKIALGQFETAKLYDGGIPMNERFHEIEIEPDSFGQDAELGE